MLSAAVRGTLALTLPLRLLIEFYPMSVEFSTSFFQGVIASCSDVEMMGFG